jgi:hypothetical protein
MTQISGLVLYCFYPIDKLPRPLYLSKPSVKTYELGNHRNHYSYSSISNYFFLSLLNLNFYMHNLSTLTSFFASQQNLKIIFFLVSILQID